MISKEFKKYKIPIKNETMKDYCLPKKYTLQPQQKFLPELLASKYSPWSKNDEIRGILVYHQIGSGKTCTAISIAEKFKKKMNIMVVLPASLIGNFIGELRSPCGNDEYITSNEMDKLKKLNPKDEEYINIIDKSNKRIDKYYTIYSYHKFVALIKERKIKKLNNTLLIIDEVQNMISMSGTFYKMLKNVIDSSNDTLRIILLSATPMFDKPIEIALTLNLIKKNVFNISTFDNTYIHSQDGNYKAQQLDDFSQRVHNLVSYYRGAPPIAYPRKIFKVVKCTMSKFQYKSYLTSLGDTEFADQNMRFSPFKDVDILNLSQNFLLGPRLISNVAYPNKMTGNKGYESFKGDVLLMKNIGKYSIKFLKILRKVKETEGPVFIYSNFIEYGVKPFIKFLEHNGWTNYENINNVTKYNTDKVYGLWTGEESREEKDNMKAIFNHPDNYNGSVIKMIIGSPAIKEGVSLLRVAQVHILDPSWNLSKMYQIIGRAVRFCSHKDVSVSDRKVEIFLYLACFPNIKTIEQHIWSNAKKKQDLINSFEHVLKETAFDCELFINSNSYKTDELKLKCY
jgi:nucleoside-triphosphatase THEP1